MSGSGDVGLATIPKGYHALRSPEWIEMERRNGEAMVAAQAALARRNGGGMPYAEAESNAGSELVSEPVGDPHEALAAAKLAHASAREAVGKVRSGRDRAVDRLDAHNRDAARFAGLDDRIRRSLIERSYSDSPDDGLSIADQIALDERRKLIERTELANRAVAAMDEELRLVEEHERQTDRSVKAAASHCVMAEAPRKAERVASLLAELVSEMQDIKALADVNLPGMHGAVPLPAVAVLALQTTVPELGRDLPRELALRAEHSRLLAADD